MDNQKPNMEKRRIAPPPPPPTPPAPPGKRKDRFVPYEEYSKKPSKYRKAPSQKGNLPDQDLAKPLADDKNMLAVNEKEAAKSAKKSVLRRKALITFVCLILSLAFNLFPFQLPYTPSLVSIDFSAFGELLAAFTVNPAIAIAIVFVKNGIYFLLNPNAAPSIPNKIVLNIIFILITWLLYRRIIQSKRLDRRNDVYVSTELAPNDFSGFVMFLSGLVSGTVTAFCSLLTFRFITMPLLQVFFGTDSAAINAMLLENYSSAFEKLIVRLPFIGMILPSIGTLRDGMFVYNLPLNFLKYFCCALLAAAVFAIVRNFIYKKDTGEAAKE